MKTKERLERAGYGSEILTVIQENFANIDLIAAEMIKTLRHRNPIQTTTQLKEVIERALSFL